MSNIDLITKDIRVENLRHISVNTQGQSQSLSDLKGRGNCKLLLLISVKVAVYIYALVKASWQQRKSICNTPLNFFRMFAISLFILFSSKSRTLAPRMSAMNCVRESLMRPCSEASLEDNTPA